MSCAVIGLAFLSLQFAGRSAPPAPGKSSASAKLEAIACLGRLEPEDGVRRLAAPSSLQGPSILAALLVREGDLVSSNQVLAVTANYRTSKADHEVALSQVKVAEGKLARVQSGEKLSDIAAQLAEVQRAEAQLANAETQFKRDEDVRRFGTSELDQLLRMIELARNQLPQSTLDRILEAVTIKVGQLLGAERSSIFLVDTGRGELRSKVAQHGGGEPLDIVVPISQTIAGQVALTGKPLNIDDAYSYPMFNRETDQRTGYRTRNILCLPIRDRTRKIIAVAQLLNKKGNQPFTQEDEQKFDAFIGSIAVILESCRMV